MIMNTNEELERFNNDIKNVKEISLLFDQTPIFIGGMATYLYGSDNLLPVNISHDVDFIIKKDDINDVETMYGPLKINNRLKKREFIIGETQYDLYIEFQHGLKFDYSELQKHSNIIQGVRVPALEHLLALKTLAYIDRKESLKGEKDLRDIITMILLINKYGINKDILSSDKYPLECIVDTVCEIKNKNKISTAYKKNVIFISKAKTGLEEFSQSLKNVMSEKLESKIDNVYRL